MSPSLSGHMCKRTQRVKSSMCLKIQGRVLAPRTRAKSPALYLCRFVSFFFSRNIVFGSWVEKWNLMKEIVKKKLPLHTFSVVTATMLDDRSDTDHRELSSRAQNAKWKTTRLKTLSLNPVSVSILAAACFLICVCSKFQTIEEKNFCVWLSTIAVPSEPNANASHPV